MMQNDYILKTKRITKWVGATQKDPQLAKMKSIIVAHKFQKLRKLQIAVIHKFSILPAKISRKRKGKGYIRIDTVCSRFWYANPFFNRLAHLFLFIYIFFVLNFCILPMNVNWSWAWLLNNTKPTVFWNLSDNWNDLNKKIEVEYIYGKLCNCHILECWLDLQVE